MTSIQTLLGELLNEEDAKAALNKINSMDLKTLKSLRYELGHSGIYTEDKLKLLEYLNNLIAKKSSK